MTRTLLMVRYALNEAEFYSDEHFGFQVPASVNGVDSRILKPRETWSDKEAYDAAAGKLVQMFQDNFAKFKSAVQAAALSRQWQCQRSSNGGIQDPSRSVLGFAARSPSNRNNSGGAGSRMTRLKAQNSPHRGSEGGMSSSVSAVSAFACRPKSLFSGNREFIAPVPRSAAKTAWAALCSSFSAS